MARRNTLEMTPEHLETEIEEQFYYIVEECVETEGTGSNTTQAIIPDRYHSEIPGECEKLSEVISGSDDNISSSLRCRLCAIPHNDMVDVFRPNVCKGPNIVQKIEYCLCIMVRESDSLPKRVCLLCLEKLEMCYNFNESVAEAEQQLLAFDRQPAREAHESTFQTETSTVAEEGRITDTIEVIDLTSASSELCSLELDPIALHPTKTGCRNSLNKVLKRNSTDDGWYVAIPWRYDDIETPLKIGPDVEMEFESRTVEVSKSAATNRIVSNESSTVAKEERLTRQCDDTETALEIYSDIDVNHESENREVPVTTGTSQHNLQSFYESEDPEADRCRSPGNSKNSGMRSKKASKNMKRSATYASDDMTERRYKCNVCAKWLKTKKGLSGHLKFHTGEGLFSCEYCGKKFVSIHGKSQHHVVHTGQQPFKCSVCEMRFAHESAMKRHAVVHSEARNYPCSLCDMSFKTVAVRQKHMLVHSSEKPLHCDNCETRFKCKDKLRRHMREIHFSLYKRKSTGMRNYKT